MKIIKYLGIAFALVVLVLGALAAYVALTFDAARIKQEAAQAVLASTGRTLTIDGDIGLSFWPNFGVRLGKVSLTERDSKTLFAGFDSARVAVRVMPLLSKQIVAERIEIDGLNLSLLRDRDGRLNIDDLLGGQKQQSGGGAPQFDIAGIHISNARLEWHDQRAARVVILAPLDFDSGHATSNAEGIGIEGLSLSTKGKLDADDFAIKLDLPALTKHGDQLAAKKLAVNATLSGRERNASVDLALDNVEGSMAALKIAGLALDVDAKSGDKSVKGGLKSPLALDLEGGILTLSNISGAFDLDMPSLPSHPLKLPISGRLKSEFRKPTLSGDLATRFDDSNIKAHFNIAGFSPLTLGIELDIDQLNVDRYLPPTAAAKSSSTAAPEQRIDLSALKAINGSGNLHVGALQAKNLKARNVRASFRAAGGRVDLVPHSADLYSGHLNGGVSVNADGNVVAVKESLTGIDIQPLLKDLADKDLVEGHGDVALDVTTRGDTVTALKKSLAGSARAVLRDGAIKGINIAQSLRNAKAKLAGGDVSQQATATSAADKTDFSELSASFKIANGVAHNDDLVAKSPFLRLAGNGDIDIGNSQLNYLFKAAVVGTAAGQGGKEVDALKGLTVPVRVSGPFEKPSFKLELANLVNDAAKARIEEKKQEVQQKLQDNLKNQLKGFFKK